MRQRGPGPGPGPGLDVGRRRRQGEDDPGAAAGVVHRADRAAVQLDDPLADRQPQAGPGPGDVLGDPEEALEDLGVLALRDADPAVGHGDLQPPVGARLGGHVDPGRPVVRGVLDRVADQVVEQLAQPDRIPLHRGQPADVELRRLDAAVRVGGRGGGQPVGVDAGDLLGQLGQVDRAQVEGGVLGGGVRQQVVDQLGHLGRALPDAQDVQLGLLRGPATVPFQVLQDAAEQQAGVAGDHPERVAQVVRDHPGEGDQFGLAGPLRGDVPERAHRPAHPGPLVQRPRADLDQQPVRVVGGADQDLDAVHGLTGQRPGQRDLVRGQAALTVRAEHPVVLPPPVHPLRAGTDAEQPLPGGVQQHEVAPLVDDGDRLPGAVQDRGQQRRLPPGARLGVTQRVRRLRHPGPGPAPGGGQQQDQAAEQQADRDPGALHQPARGQRRRGQCGRGRRDVDRPDPLRHRDGDLPVLRAQPLDRGHQPGDPDAAAAGVLGVQLDVGAEVATGGGERLAHEVLGPDPEQDPALELPVRAAADPAGGDQAEPVLALTDRHGLVEHEGVRVGHGDAVAQPGLRHRGEGGRDPGVVVARRHRRTAVQPPYHQTEDVLAGPARLQLQPGHPLPPPGLLVRRQLGVGDRRPGEGDRGRAGQPHPLQRRGRVEEVGPGQVGLGGDRGAEQPDHVDVAADFVGDQLLDGGRAAVHRLVGGGLRGARQFAADQPGSDRPAARDEDGEQHAQPRPAPRTEPPGHTLPSAVTGPGFTRTGQTSPEQPRRHVVQSPGDPARPAIRRSGRHDWVVRPGRPGCDRIGGRGAAGGRRAPRPAGPALEHRPGRRHPGLAQRRAGGPAGQRPAVVPHPGRRRPG